MTNGIEFFGTDNTQKALGRFLSKIESSPAPTEFEEARNQHIKQIVKSMRANHFHWDSSCQINVEWIGSSFMNVISSNEESLSKKYLDDVFATCFRFLFELYLSTRDELAIEYSRAKEFGMRELDKFDSHAREQIEYAIRQMPISIFKAVANGEEIESIKEFNKVSANANLLRSQWDADLVEREKRVGRLRDDLQKYQSAFNFVGLFQGFDDLAHEKEKERKSISFWLRIMGAIAVFPLLLEISAVYFKWIDISDIGEILLVTIPTVSFVIISIYYFRVLLHVYNGIKAQLLQIDLRKTLCRFIQHYADYATEIKGKDKGSLEKFENIIFSGLVADDDKIPSAYDGLEQLAKLIKSVRA